MPVTPYHFGPGVLIKALAPRTVSLTAFVAANVVIDVESVVNILAGRYPIHATLHTFLAAIGVGALVGGGLVVLGKFLGERAVRFGCELTPRAALVGGVLGGLFQPLLDGVMHSDIRPFLPLSDANPLFRAVDLGLLHSACLWAGGLGLAMLMWRRWRRPPGG